MQRLRHYVGPSWPPDIGAYDYALALCPSDLAWEFLRRNPDYQRDYRLSRRGCSANPSSEGRAQLTRVRRYTPRSGGMGTASLLSIRRCRHRKPRLLAGKRRYTVLEAIVRSRKRRPRSRPLDRSVRRRRARHLRPDRRRAPRPQQMPTWP